MSINPFCPLLCGQRTNNILEHIKNICKNKDLLGDKYFQCPYNPEHIFGKKVFQLHVDRCPDRFKKKKEKAEEDEKEEDEKGGNIIFEEEEVDDNEKENENKNTLFVRQHKRNNTASNIDKFHHQSKLKNALLFPKDNQGNRKSIISVFKSRFQIEREEQEEQNKVKLHNIFTKNKNYFYENDNKEESKIIKNNSLKDLNYKGILKHNKLTEEDYKHQKSNSISKFPSRKKEESQEEPLINFNEDESETEGNLNLHNFKRGKKRSVSFKGFVKVFVFEDKNKKKIPKRSAFAKSNLKHEEPENKSEDNISDVYMKSL